MPKVLIVNHNEDMMELIKGWLNKKGFETKCVNEEEAIFVMREFKPDVVVIDVLQIEAAKKIKQEKELLNTAIIVMAGYNLTTDDYKIVADEVVDKPFNPKQIEEKIYKVLKHTG